MAVPMEIKMKWINLFLVRRKTMVMENVFKIWSQRRHWRLLFKIIVVERRSGGRSGNCFEPRNPIAHFLQPLRPVPSSQSTSSVRRVGNGRMAIIAGLYWFLYGRVYVLWRGNKQPLLTVKEVNIHPYHSSSLDKDFRQMLLLGQPSSIINLYTN